MEATSSRASLRPAARPGLALRHPSRERRVSLCETLDRVLNKGTVIAGDIVISIADVDLLYVGLHLMVTSVETMRSLGSPTTLVNRPFNIPMIISHSTRAPRPLETAA